MASPHEVQVTLGNRRITHRDPTLGSALERVLEAEQGLVVRHARLLLEELTEQGTRLVVGSLIAAVGTALALVGWVIAVVGLVDALDNYFARFAVEIAVGAFHLAAGLAILAWLRRSRATT